VTSIKESVFHMATRGYLLPAAIQYDISISNDEKLAAVINNCGSHGLCGTKSKYVRDAFDSYVTNEAKNIAQYATADHTN
jgi:hypothetical protein